MGKRTFDDLLLALQDSLAGAREGLARREQALRRRHGGGEAGAAGAPAFSFTIPGEREESVTLPASSFRSRTALHISLLALEFSCELKLRGIAPGSPAYALAIVPDSPPKWWQKRRWRMLIVVRTDGTAGEVFLDGKVLTEIPPETARPPGAPVPAKGKGSMFSRMFSALRSLRRRPTFIFSAEQSARVAEILRQQES